jgi:spore maturation protein CgeB
LLNEDFRRRIGAAARETVLQHHTLDHQARSLAQVYRECVR